MHRCLARGTSEGITFIALLNAMVCDSPCITKDLRRYGPTILWKYRDTLEMAAAVVPVGSHTKEKMRSQISVGHKCAGSPGVAG
jgi:hypothetical protein